MKLKNKIKDNIEIWGLALLFLFFFQSLTMLISAIYQIDLLNTSIDAYAIGIIGLLFSGLLAFFRTKTSQSQDPLISKRKLILLRAIGITFILLRILAPLFQTKPRIFIIGGAVACFMIYFPLYLYLISVSFSGSSISNFAHRKGMYIGTSLLLAILLSVCFRTINNTIDITMYKGLQSLGWVLGCFAGYYIIMLEFKSSKLKVDKVIAPEKKVNLLPTLGLVFGLVNILLLLYFSFESPAVIARWTEGSYIGIIIVLSLVLSAAVLIWWKWPLFVMTFQKKHPIFYWVWNLCFIVSFLVMLLIHTENSPPLPGSPALIVSAPLWYYHIPLYFMLLSSPIIFLDIAILTKNLIHNSLQLRHLAISFMIGGIYAIIVIFIFVFTNIWGYVGAVSLIFRNKFWLPFTLIFGFVLISLIPVQFNKSRKRGIPAQSNGSTKENLENNGIALSKIILIGGILFTIFTSVLITTVPKSYSARNDSSPNISSLVVMTYNIQMGVNVSGEKNYDQQLDVIRSVNPDIVALQESDSAKIGGGNTDVVRYFANKLGYYSYYGPKKVTGTYGTAFLSRYPIESAETIFTYSDQDEVGTAYIQIRIGQNTFHFFNNHPDGSHEAKLAHITAVMEIIQDLENVISMGDFNSRQGSIYYNHSISQLVDTWLAIYPTGIGLGLNMSRRIDHIFVSPEFGIANSTYIPSPESQTDHPVYWTTLTF